MAISMVYYGLSLSASSFAGGPFVNLALLGLMEIPGIALAFFSVDRAGRRSIMSGCLIVCGICCALIPAVPSGIHWLTTTLALLGKLFSSGAFSIIYVYSAEVYPTNVRAIGLGTGSMFARVGSLSAPFVADLGNLVWLPLPQIVFGVVSLAAGLLCLMLPETLGHKLPDTAEEGENFARAGSRCPPCCTSRIRRANVYSNGRIADSEKRPMTETDTSANTCKV